MTVYFSITAHPMMHYSFQNTVNSNITQLLSKFCMLHVCTSVKELPDTSDTADTIGQSDLPKQLSQSANSMESLVATIFQQRNVSKLLPLLSSRKYTGFFFNCVHIYIGSRFNHLADARQLASETESRHVKPANCIFSNRCVTGHNQRKGLSTVFCIHRLMDVHERRVSLIDCES